MKTARKKRPTPRLVTKALRLERDEPEAAYEATQRAIRQTDGKRSPPSGGKSAGTPRPAREK